MQSDQTCVLIVKCTTPSSEQAGRKLSTGNGKAIKFASRVPTAKLGSSSNYGIESRQQRLLFSRKSEMSVHCDAGRMFFCRKAFLCMRSPFLGLEPSRRAVPVLRMPRRPSHLSKTNCSLANAPVMKQNPTNRRIQERSVDHPFCPIPKLKNAITYMCICIYDWTGEKIFATCLSSGGPGTIVRAASVPFKLPGLRAIGCRSFNRCRLLHRTPKLNGVKQMAAVRKAEATPVPRL